jgi:sporulation protein YlmC with PRC-barrel domain
MDQGIVDSVGERCGRVDDVVVEDVFDRPPRITALLSGGGVKSQLMWKPLHRFSLWLHVLLGVARPVQPVEVRWEQVERVDDDVILKAPCKTIGLNRLNRAAAERFIGRIPGASK